VRPLLFLGTRAEDGVAEAEYHAVLRFTGLDERDVRRVRLEERPLGEVDLGDWSGIVLGGGPFNVSDPPEKKSETQHRVEAELADLAARVVAADFPFLGACYGIGVIGTHRGATIDREYSEPIGPVPVTLTPEGRADPLLADLPEHFDAFVGHKEAVSHLPEHATLLASSPDCPVQAFRVGSNVYATQFHPELDIAGLVTRIEVYKHSGYFEPHEADSYKAMARASTVLEPPKILTRFVQRYARA
jgi:GMP synthase (glutamine-hydrolysing)